MRRLPVTAVPLVVLLACGGSLNGPPYNPATPASDTSGGMQVASTASGASADPMAAVKARGALHGEPILIPASGGRPQRWLLFLGSADVARAAWVVTPGAAVRDMVPVEDWPEGVKVVAHEMRGQIVYVLVETLQTLDQPAGIRSVWQIDANYGTAGTLDDDWRFVNVKSDDDLKARLAAPPPGAAIRHEDMVATLNAAGLSLAAVAKAFPESGADYYMAWQGELVQQVEHLDAKTIGKSQRARRILNIVAMAGSQERCESSICWAQDDQGLTLGGVALVLDGGSVVIQGIIEHQNVPPGVVGGAPGIVAASSGTSATEQALTEQVLEKPRAMLGEAPLTKQGGTIGVGVSPAADKHLMVVVRDGSFERIYHEKTMVAGGLVPKEVRFADVDGDGRTDVIARATGLWTADHSNITYTRALLAPRSVQNMVLRADIAAELAMQGMPTIDDAAKSAIAVPTHGVDPKEVCRTLVGIHTVAGFQKMATPDARVVTFDQLGAPFLHGTVKAANLLRPDDVRDAGTHCGRVVCDPARPVCTFIDSGILSEIYWFNWGADGKPLVAGAAFYNGQ
jgi:hypothetical protein